jgi:hypothetical protein
MMKNRVFLLIAGLFFLFHTTWSQTEDARDFRNFPIVISIQFHSLAMPFRDLKSNFRNVGIGLGTEVSLNGYSNWVQQFNIIWFRNKNTGNGLLFNTQVAWRPYIYSYSYGEIKAGLGYQIAYRPTESFVENEGKWTSAGRKGKGMLAVLTGLSLGYHEYSQDVYLSPFVSYQVVFLKNYSKSIPFMPETLIQAGLGIHPY